MKSKCDVDWCNKDAFANGKCGRHNAQFQRHGRIYERTIRDPNEIEIHDDFAFIVIYDKQCNVKAKVMIDLGDVEMCSKYKWSQPQKYVTTKVKGETVALQNLIIGNKEGHEVSWVDHVDRNPLDNRKSNLRLATPSQNLANRRLDHRNTTGYKGVSKISKQNLWSAQIQCNREYIRLGLFKSSKMAALAYNFAAEKYFGEFAYFNKVF